MRTVRPRILVGVIVGALILMGAAPSAHATFPGSNGRIAFLLYYHGTDIYSMNPDGTDVQRLTHFTPEHVASGPSWSPDGSTIVFEHSTPQGHQLSIWTMNADGSNQHRLFPDPWFDDQSPSFSPDGTKILFSRCQPDFGEEHRCSVATVNADGTDMRFLTTPSAEEKVFWPVYSPDGSQIAFSVFYGRGVQAGIFVMNADGSNIRLVTPPKLYAWVPSWAPDSSHLVFGTHAFGTPRAIARVNPDGTGLRQITDPGRRHDFQPVYSPDGSQIVFERDAPNYRGYGLYTMSPDGTGITRILNRAFGAAWQPVP